MLNDKSTPRTVSDDLARETARSSLRLDRSRRPGISPIHIVLATVAGELTWLSAVPISDLDSYWHVEIGREILARGTTHNLGTGWLAIPAPSWTTSQWLAEVAMTQAVDTWGWRALVFGKLLLLTGIIVAVGVALMPRRPVLLSAPIALLVAVALLGNIQERPQTAAFVFLPLCATSCLRLWQDRIRPPLFTVAVCSIVWAQLHGSWVLGPAAFGVVALGCVPRGLNQDRAQVKAALAAMAASLAGLINPQGVSSLLLPFQFAGARAFISEWSPTALPHSFTLAWAVVVLLTILAWAQSPTHVPRIEVLWVLGWFSFGFLAYRNVVPSLLLIAPVAVAALDRTWGATARAQQRPNSRRESVLLWAALGATLAVGIGGAALSAAQLDPLERAPARHIAERLAASPQPVRVFNAYNAAGPLIAFGGGKVRLVVDGRTDMWGTRYVLRYLDATALVPGWEDTVRAFRPDAFVLTEKAPLVGELLREGSWRVAQRDGDYVLLLPVGATP